MRALPELEFIRKVIRPDKAQKLAGLLVAQTADQPGYMDWDYRFNHRIAFSTLPEQPTRPTKEVIEAICAQALTDVEGQELLVETTNRAIGHMSGLKRRGLLRGFEPTCLGLDLNVYLPGEDFPTHTDGGKASDVVMVALAGEKEFMHTSRSALKRMPEPDEVLRSWRITPGQGMAIRNHQAADYSGGSPPHAVQNGNSMAVSLQVQMYYDTHN